jgi:hypothetical protein
MGWYKKIKNIFYIFLNKIYFKKNTILNRFKVKLAAVRNLLELKTIVSSLLKPVD